jgi:hypothetical protein
MEQRRLRLGDILDDYCPRERRLTNHAVVAMVEETVKQTRCTTCDAEHAYKGGQTPRRRKKEDGPSALYKEVLAGKPDTDTPPRMDVPEVVASADSPDDGELADDEVNGNVMAEGESRPAAIVNRPVPVVPARAVAPPSQPGNPESNENRDQPDGDSFDEDNDQRGPDVEDGPVHRQLIRATLPRIEGHKEERRPTDFTIRQPGGRGNNVGNQFRGGGGNDRMRSGGRAPGGSPGQGGNQGHRGNGHRPHGGPRFAGASRSGQGPGHGQGQGRGQGGGFRSSQQQPRQGGGRKRSR